MARAPKANMAKVTAYEASPKAVVDTWLSFESDYYTRILVDEAAEAAA